MNLRALVLPALLVAATVPAPLLAQTVPCGYEANLGTPLGMLDDDIAAGLALGFNFTFPDGTVTSSIDVDSNGRILLPGGDTTDYTESVAELLTQSSSICVLWEDLNPAAPTADDVYFNALPGKAVITWKDCVRYSDPQLFTAQCTLWADGRIWFVYDDRTPSTIDGIVGLSAGNGAADPGGVDFSARPFSVTGRTSYELFTTGFDLRDAVVEFVDNSTSYAVGIPAGCASAAELGHGCGEGAPASFYELFDSSHPNDLSNSAGLTASWVGNGYVVTSFARAIVPAVGRPLTMGAYTTVRVTLPWAMPTQRGPITYVWVCSNGWVSFDPTTSTSSGETIAGLLRDETKIACIWDDLNPGAGGGVHAEQDATDPSLFHITWDQVPETGVAAGANTCQLTLSAGGGWELKFGPMTMQDGLTGYSFGHGATDPGGTDLTAIPGGAIVVGDERPDLTLARIDRPILGRTVSTQTNDIPAGSLAGFHLYGVTAFPHPGLDLGVAGAPGCVLYQNADGAVPFAVALPVARHSLTIPNVAALAGAHVYSQSVCVTPGSNALGVITSNAVDWLLGIN